MPPIEMVDSKIVFRDSSASEKPKQAYFPSVVEMPDGELVVTMDIGSDMDDPDTRSFLCRSADGGETWSKPTLIFDPDSSGGPKSTSCRISGDADGMLTALVTLVDRSTEGKRLTNPATDGYAKTEFVLLRSTDTGRTWAEPVEVTSPLDWSVFETCSPVLSLDGGRRLIPCSTFRDWEGNCPMGLKAIVFVSDDGGKTWPRCVDVMNHWDHEITSWEQKQTRLSDGRLMAVCWAYDYRNRTSLRNRYTLSDDGGDSYCESLESPLNGETCTVLGLADNRILCVYRRTDKPGLWAHLAQIEEKSWCPIQDEILWGAGSSAYALRSESMLEEMSTLQFGYPSVIRLSTGEAFAVFWCVEEGLAGIRWLRLRIE